MHWSLITMACSLYPFCDTGAGRSIIVQKVLSDAEGNTYAKTLICSELLMPCLKVVEWRKGCLLIVLILDPGISQLQITFFQSNSNVDIT